MNCFIDVVSFHRVFIERCFLALHGLAKTIKVNICNIKRMTITRRNYETFSYIFHQSYAKIITVVVGIDVYVDITFHVFLSFWRLIRAFIVCHPYTSCSSLPRYVWCCNGILLVLFVVVLSSSSSFLFLLLLLNWQWTFYTACIMCDRHRMTRCIEKTKIYLNIWKYRVCINC